MGLIRCLLALAVILWHSPPIFGIRMVDGYLAVQTFYMISGFYMSLILNEKYLPENSTYHNHLAPLSAVGLALPNLTILGQDVLLFLKLNLSTGLLHYAGPVPGPNAVPAYHFLLVPQAWTLAVELLFYLLAPFLVRRSTKVILGMIGLSVVLRLVLRFGFGLNYDPWTVRFFPTELVFFLAGAVGYRLYRRLRAHDGFHLNYSRAALTAVVAFIVLYDTPALRSLPGERAIYFVVMAAAFPMIFLLTKNNRRDRYIGDLSYPLYISHVLILNILRVWGINNAFATFGASLAVSLLLLEGIDRPVERFRQSLFEREKKLAQPERNALP